MNDLIIIHAKNRLINGKKLSLPISSFIKEIPSECIAIKEVRIKKDVPKQNGLFSFLIPLNWIVIGKKNSAYVVLNKAFY